MESIVQMNESLNFNVPYFKILFSIPKAFLPPAADRISEVNGAPLPGPSSSFIDSFNSSVPKIVLYFRLCF